MSAQRRRCPVCKRRVRKTTHGFIEGHTDNAGLACEGTGEPYRIALTYPTAGELAS